MHIQIKKNIYDDILELSDKNTQEVLWLGKHPHRISSFTEVMCRLFDDNFFDMFLETKVYHQGFDDSLMLELNTLREVMNAYDEGDKLDSEIIEDPEWEKVVNQAKIVISIWDRIKPLDEQPLE